MSKGLVYACACSRKDIQSETAQSMGELRYPGTCRDKKIPFDQPETSLRLIIPDAPWTFEDILQGQLTHNPAEQCGDVMIRDRLGQWTYQFTVVIDDLEQGINLIVRGLDLLSSTARQLAMRAIIDPTAQMPVFAHHQLLKEPTGQKLSKRDQSESIAKLRDEGMTPAQVRDLAMSLKPD